MLIIEKDIYFLKTFFFFENVNLFQLYVTNVTSLYLA